MKLRRVLSGTHRRNEKGKDTRQEAVREIDHEQEKWDAAGSRTWDADRFRSDGCFCGRRFQKLENCAHFFPRHGNIRGLPPIRSDMQCTSKPSMP